VRKLLQGQLPLLDMYGKVLSGMRVRTIPIQLYTMQGDATEPFFEEAERKKLGFFFISAILSCRTDD